MICQPCRTFLQQHRRGVRRLAFLLALGVFFFLLGRYAGKAVYSPGMCRVYF